MSKENLKSNVTLSGGWLDEKDLLRSLGLARRDLERAGGHADGDADPERLDLDEILDTGRGVDPRGGPGLGGPVRLEAAGVLHGEDVLELRGARVGDVDLVVPREVVRVVERELGLARELRRRAEDGDGVDQAAADLQGRGPEAEVLGGAVGPGDGAARGDDAGVQGLCEAGAVDGATAVGGDVQGGDAGDVGAGHGRPRAVAVAEADEGGKDAAAGRRDVGLQLEVEGAAPGGEDGGPAAAGVVHGDVVAGLVEGEVGRDGAAGEDGLDDGLAGVLGEQAPIALRPAGAGEADDGPVGEVEEHEAGAALLDPALPDVVLAPLVEAHEGDDAREVEALGQRLARVVLDGEVQGHGYDGPADDLGREKLLGRTVAEDGAVGVAVEGEGAGELAGRDDVGVGGAHGEDVRSGGAAAGEEGTDVARVAGGDGDDNALLDDAGGDEGPGVVGPAAGGADRGRDDVDAVVEGAEEGLDQDLFAGALLCVERDGGQR
ncbi:hypothetical protein ColKHC_05352 [Colletotrichum higginsianum]|nr:hypothetical protein ColKHC_05352 [Colletotrichum higginsianum]